MLNTWYTFFFLSFLSSWSRPNLKIWTGFWSQNCEIGKQGLGFSWWKPQVLAHYESCEGGREVHPWAGIHRTKLGAPFSQLKTEFLKSGLLQLAPLGSEVLASFRLQIDSTDRCEYSATSVDVFTHVFMLWFDLGTLEKLNKGIRANVASMKF